MLFDGNLHMTEETRDLIRETRGLNYFVGTLIEVMLERPTPNTRAKLRQRVMQARRQTSDPDKVARLARLYGWLGVLTPAELNRLLGFVHGLAFGGALHINAENALAALDNLPDDATRN